jgi:predicted solute-binding protein
MFVLNQSVVYRGMEGYIVYIDDNYVIMETPAAEGRNSPRLIILRKITQKSKQKSDIQILTTTT